jgi:VWFA-related protein
VSTTSREASPLAPVLPLPFAANDGPVPGRSVIIVVDHESIRPSESRNAIEAAGRFLSRLTPIDRVALVTMPNGRVESDLTTHHARVREALTRVIGRAGLLQNRTGMSNISLEEAMTVLAERNDPDKKFTGELIDRECKSAPEDSYCRTRVVQEALRVTRELEQNTHSSLVALNEFLNGLAAIEGPKAIVYIAGTLISFPDTHIDLEDVARAAARARAQMFIVQPHDTISTSERRDSSTTTSADINIRVSGLQDLAGVTGGELFRMSGTGDLVFNRIADQIASHYLIGFEPRAEDYNGKPHKIQITTTRRDTDIRARPMFILDDKKASAGPPPMVLETLLRDFATYRDLSLRASAYVFRDLDPQFVKIVVATEPAEGATLKSAAFALINLQGQAAAQWTEDSANVVTRPLLTGAAVPPGDYRLRVVAVDSTGRRGAVDYEFTARLTEPETTPTSAAAPRVSASTLMVGWSDQGNFRPRLLFAADASTVTGYLEFYASLPSGSVLTATFEIADSADGPALFSAPARILASPQATRFVMTGDVPAARVVPGDHLLRALISVNDKPVLRASRTFRK